MAELGRNAFRYASRLAPLRLDYSSRTIQHGARQELVIHCTNSCIAATEISEALQAQRSMSTGQGLALFRNVLAAIGGSIEISTSAPADYRDNALYTITALIPSTLSP